MNEPRMGFILFIVNFNDLEWDGGGRNGFVLERKRQKIKCKRQREERRIEQLGSTTSC